MSLKKTVAIAAAAGAMAAISVPAMAFENEFHGSYTFNTIFSNFQSGASKDYNPAGTRDKIQTNNYFEQRARLQYIAKASDDLKLVTHFEINNRFGNKNTVAGSTAAVDVAGNDLDTDGLNLVTKHVYLDFNLGKNFNVKTGLQPYKDTIKGLFIDGDLPMISTTTKLGAYTLGLGFARFGDEAASGGNVRLGDQNKDLFFLDNTFAVSKDTKLGLSYYFLADYEDNAAAGNLPAHGNNQALLLHTLGLSGETKIGALGLSGFAAAQTGHQKLTGNNNTSKQFHGWAANVAAKMAVGPGTAKTAFLFTSGNNSSDNSHNKGWVTPLNSYNEGSMMILARSTANSPTSTDQYVRKYVTNVALATIGYDAKLSEKLYANANVGFGWAPASNPGKATASKNASDFLGTEINLETGYKVYQNLTLRAQAAYMILGSFYKDTASNSATKDPENPYTARLLASFAF